MVDVNKVPSGQSLSRSSSRLAILTCVSTPKSVRAKVELEIAEAERLGWIRQGASARSDAATTWHNFIRNSYLPRFRKTTEIRQFVSMVIGLRRVQGGHRKVTNGSTVPAADLPRAPGYPVLSHQRGRE
jgi:hypothetical protein